MKMLSKKNIILFILILCIMTGILTGYFLFSDSGENASHEIVDYLKVLDVNYNEQKPCDEAWRNNEQITVCVEGEEITEIVLKEADIESNLQWTLYGLYPRMSLEDVQKLLNVPGIVMEQHNMQWYATGLELERNGIQRLCWDTNDTITYVSALVNTEMIEELQDYELVVKEKTYVFCDDNRKINIVINYPLIEIKEHKDITDAMNKNINGVIDKFLQNCDLSNMENVSMNVSYSIRNAESGCFSIEWTGTYVSEGHTKEVRAAMTCNIRDGGELLQLTDFGMTKEQLADEISWREDLNGMEIYDQLTENYFDYYVTPLCIVVYSNNPNTGEQMVTSIWR